MYSASIKWYNYTTIPNILILNVPHTVIQLYIIQLAILYSYTQCIVPV